MAISYSLSKKRMTFGKESGKLYATAQHNGVLGEMEFAKRVSRRAAKPPAILDLRRKKEVKQKKVYLCWEMTHVKPFKKDATLKERKAGREPACILGVCNATLRRILCHGALQVWEFCVPLGRKHRTYHGKPLRERT